MEEYTPVVARNLRTEPKVALKQATIRWTNCVAERFLPGWLNGEALNVVEVCREEHEAMKELDSQIYTSDPSFIPRPAE
jgi:hypothetical protein